jgi:hypothetical protein
MVEMTSRGGDTRVVVQFDKEGQKVFILEQSQLEPV